MKYTEHMKKRIDGHEGRLPVKLMHKSNLQNFCGQVGVRMPQEILKFDSVDDIDPDRLPEKFVLKPAFASAGEGVMLLERQEGGGFYDQLSKKGCSSADIVKVQESIDKKYSRVRRREFIVEQYVQDGDGSSVPPDYKFLAFQGEVGVIIRIDRTNDRLRMSYFDGEFTPVVDDRIRFNNSIADREWLLPPSNWFSLLNMARRISVAVPTPCARIDLFSDVSGPMLGEITLTPGSFYYSAGHTLKKSEDERLGALWEKAAMSLGFAD